MRRRLAFAGACLVLAAFLLAELTPAVVERRLNGAAPAAARKPARSYPLGENRADLHADSLLWTRDLLARGSRGSVDVPRLLEGGFALQVFGLVTRVPYPLGSRNGPGPDAVAKLAVASLWPPRTWLSPLQRALYQAGRLDKMAAASGGRLDVVRTSEDLRAVLERRSRGEPVVGALLAVEGAHALEGRLENLDALNAAGVRMMSPSHFFDSDIGGSAHGLVRSGLSALGREWVSAMESRRMIIDLAHASPQTVADVLAAARRPVVVSHTGVRGTCDNQRNLSDEQLRAVARNGGLIGIGYWTVAVCGSDPASIARAIKHAIAVAGVSHVALGSDFDGAVRMPFDAAHVDALARALEDQGLSPADIRAVMGGNALRFLERELP